MAKRKLEVVIVGNDASLQRALGTSLGGVSKFASRMKATGRTLTRSVTLPLVGIAAASGKLAIDFDRDMRNVNSIAQLPEAQFKKLQKSVLALAGPTAQAPSTLAKGLYDLVSSGFTANESLTILKSSAKAASAGLTTTEISTKAVAAVLNAYHRPASDAANISDVLFQTVNRGVISFEELATTVGDVLPFASSLGVNINQVGASISTMTKAGISGAETMTRIKNVMVAFLKPSKGLSAAIEQTGFKSAESLIKAKGFQGALEAVAGTTDGTKSAMAKLFPNIRALGGALALTGKNSKAANADLKAFKDVTGATEKAFREQSKSVGFQWQRAMAIVKAAAISVGLKVLPVLIPIIKDVARSVQGAVEAFDRMNPTLKKVIVGATLFAAALGPVLVVVGTVAAALAAIGAPALAVGAALIGVGVAAKKMGVSLNDVKKVATTAFNAVKGAVNSVRGAITSWVAKNREDINRIVQAIRNWGTATVAIIKAATLPLRTVAGPAFQFLLATVKRVLPGIVQVVQGTMRTITGVIRVFSGVLTGDFGAAWKGLKGIVSGSLKTVGGVIRAFTAPFRQAAETLAKAVSVPIRAAFSALKSAVITLANAILGVFSTLLSGAASFLRAMAKIPLIGGKFKGLADQAQNAANKINNVRAQLDALKDKTVHVRVQTSGGTGGAFGKNKAGGQFGKTAAANGPIFGLESSLAAAQADQAGLQASFDAADLARRRTTAQRGLRSKNKDTVKQSRDDLRDLNREMARAKQLGAIDLKIAGYERAIRFKDVVKNIRQTLQDTAKDAAAAFRARREKEIDSALQGQLDAIGKGAEAQELAALQAQDKREQDARTEADLNRALADAKAEGDKDAVARAEADIAAYKRQKREEELQASLDAAIAKANADAETTRLGLDQEEADFQSSLSNRLSMLATNLDDQRTSYAEFVKDVQAILRPLGLVFDPSSDQEAGILGIQVKGVPKRGSGKVKKGRGKKRRASGGPVAAYEAYIVGEQGPEVLQMGDRSGSIIPNHRVRGWGGLNVTMNVDRIGSQVDLRRELNRMAFRLGV